MKLLDFPTIRQTFDYDCGTKVVQGVLNYYEIDIREDILMKECGTSITTGTLPTTIITTLEKHGFICKPGTYTITELKHSIDREHPVILALQAWPKEPVENWESEWDEGHYAVAIGYDDKHIYFADPSSINVVFLSFDELEKRWHDQDALGKKYDHYGIIAVGGDNRYKRDNYRPMQ